jgi:hypothetical protein
VVLAIKFGPPFGEDPSHRGASRRWITEGAGGSLRWLQTDWIDLYQMGVPDPDTDIGETPGALTDLGELEAVYVDTATDLPSFGTVKVGMPTRHRLVFVPLDQATVGPGYLKVCYDKKQVKDAPSIGTDGELPAGDEEAIFKHYGLTYEPGAGGERRLARR